MTKENYVSKLIIRGLPKMQWQCCDCGLVHNVEFKIRLLDVRMTRNQKETLKVRKNK